MALPLRSWSWWVCLIALLIPVVARCAETPRSEAPKVDFGYAFGYPHRITVAVPDSSDKTLVDCEPGKVTISWTYEDLRRAPTLSFVNPRTEWRIIMQPQVDGKNTTRSTWRRMEGWLPALESDFETDSAVQIRMHVVGGTRAALVRVEMKNTDTAKSHRAGLMCYERDNWKAANPGFIDPDLNHQLRDTLVAGWKDRADRVIITALGADEYKTGPTMVTPEVDLAPGETKVMWVVRPYRVYQSMLTEMRRRDWAGEFAESLEVWRKLLGRATKLDLPDAGVRNAYYAGLADIFIMREPILGDYMGTVPGTEQYRAGNSGESAIAGVALNQAGMSLEAIDGYRASLDQQGPDGNWADPQGWAWGIWFSSGFKGWFISEHYRLSGDKEFLADIFPRMLASSRWQERMRARTRVLTNGKRSLDYGLLPRGMGDAGLKNDDSNYGVFLPHNMWAVYGDEVSWRAAETLGRPEAAELKQIYETARADLLTAIRDGAIAEKDYKWIPGVAGKTSGSRWGVLNAVFPCGLLAMDDELITGTIRKMETNLSPGGIPMNTGWMVDGMWVAITLDNLAEVQLRRGDSDAFARYLYATLNHGTALYSWCEERGPEPGATKTTGDRQHLWTPVAVARAIRDGMIYEEGETLHLARGADRSWLARGPVGGSNFRTHFGEVAYQLSYAEDQSQVRGNVKLNAASLPKALKVYVRLPEGVVVKSVTDPKAKVSPDGLSIEWAQPNAQLDFVAVVGK